MAETQATCSVCCEHFNRTTRKQVQCFCEFVACRKCCEKVLLDSISDPQCMSCRKEWSREFLDTQFTKTFVNNDLKKHREKVLFDRERSMLPATQVYVERKKRETEIYSEYLKLNEKMKALKLERETILRRYYRVQRGLPEEVQQGQEENTPQTVARREFIRACPFNGCKGFLSTQWRCGICEMWTCPDCHEVKGKNKDAEHTCKQENVETAKLLSKDSQPCPQCGALCTKVDGCDQVFAMCCGTTFSWRTGKIDTGPVHAPDYYRWLQLNGKPIPRNNLDIQCGGIPDIYAIDAVLSKLKVEVDTKKQIQLIHCLIIHIQRVELHDYAVMVRREVDNRDLRIKYMMDEIDDTRFMAIVQQREKARTKSKEIHDMLSTVSLAGTDIIQRMSRSNNKEDIDSLIDELKTLKKYNNEAMHKISKRYKSRVPIINEVWKIDRLTLP